MFIVLLSWVYIAAVSWILGRSFHLFWEKKSGISFATPEGILLSGLACSAVYAQLFSLFYGIGALANGILLGICIILIIFIYVKFHSLKALFLIPQQNHKPSFKRVVCSIIVCTVILLYISILTAQTPIHYDTYLYHAQAIHWIEEYGCVTGLGNLHNRFAYNSSFLVLQALYSFHDLTGTSLHTLNGFIAAMFLCWCLVSLKFFREKKLFISDGLRLALIYYLLHNSTYLSSPNTDTFALSLVLYLFIKWGEFLEQKESHYEPYAWLCLLGVFGCTLKLSSAFVLVFLIKPISMIFRKEKHPWKKFGSCSLMALALALPYFLRSIRISGYLLYPYSGLDLFPFLDWKMDPGVLDYDRMEIVAWGRGTYDMTTLDWPVTQWFPIWFSQQTSVGKREIVAALVAVIGLLVTSILLIKKKDWDLLLYSLTSLVCLFGWFFSAPLIRYGEVYLLLVSVIFVFYWLQKVRGFHRTKMGFLSLSLLLVVLRVSMMQIAYYPQGLTLSYQDYASYHCIETDWEGNTIYVAEIDTQTGYDPFPTVFSEETLDELTLRGDSLKNGFAPK